MNHHTILGSAPILPIAFIGDVHESIDNLEHAVAGVLRPGVTTLIQVGDYNLYSTSREKSEVDEMFCDMARSRGIDPDAVQMLFIDGNRDRHNLLDHDAAGPVRFSRHVTYVPRGVAMTLHGYRIGFLGGAASPDNPDNVIGENTFPEQENISHAQWSRAMDMGVVDILVTHDATSEVFEELARIPGFLRYPGKIVGQMDRDAITMVLEEVCPRWHVHGHYHRYGVSSRELNGFPSQVTTVGLGACGGHGCSALLVEDGSEALPAASMDYARYTTAA